MRNARSARESAHLHCLYRVVGLRDGVDRQPLCRVWQKELIDYFYLVIGRSDGGETLSHVVSREKVQTTMEAIETRKRLYAISPKIFDKLLKWTPVVRLGLDT